MGLEPLPRQALVCRKRFPFFDHLTLGEVWRLEVLADPLRHPPLAPYEVRERRELIQRREASGLRP